MLNNVPNTETCPSSLDTAALARRLSQLAGDERAVQVEFLLHLDVFDRRRGWAEAGYPSLWEWCLKVLHLREGSAGRRIGAMRVLRRFPVLADLLRDGRLCPSTVTLLGPVLTEENLEEVVGQAAYLTKAQVERLVVTMAPREPPREGLRKLPSRPETPVTEARNSGGTPLFQLAPDRRPAEAGDAAAADFPQRSTATTAPVPPIVSRPTIRPVDATRYSLHVTVDATFKEELETLKDLLGHKIPTGDLGAVLREAVRCAIETHGKRKGAVAPERKTKAVAPRTRRAEPPERLRLETPPPVTAPTGRRPIPARIRREVWRRDEGRCSWRGPDGRRCGSTWKLEIDHIRPVALGGLSTLDNLRITCAGHNQLSAEQIFGPEYMDRVRGSPRRAGAAATPGDSAPAPP